ncbi:MAG: hypothetical protein ABIR81_09135 [Ginsengibacter sp.]
MPLYRITFRAGKKRFNGLKEHASSNHELVFEIFRRQAEASIGRNILINYDCLMLSTNSDDYKRWEKEKTLNAKEQAKIVNFKSYEEPPEPGHVA